MNAVTHLEKVIVGEVSAVTHLEKVIAGETSAVTYTEKVITGGATPITHLQKVIAGEASPVTHLEHIWAGGSPTPTEHEYTGAVPYTFTANGSPLISLRISGNTVQTGTPTPDNPIMPQGTGERTGNLYNVPDKSATANSLVTLVDLGIDTTFNTITISCMFNNLVATDTYGAFLDFLKDDNTHQYITLSNMYNVADDTPVIANTITTGNYYATKNNITFRYITAYLYSTAYNKYQSGTIKWAFYDSEKKDYEPYGYKIPISSANTTTPVYLGEVETTRKIKKYEYTGSETWNTGTENYYSLVPQTYGDGVPYSAIICSHCINATINNTGKAVSFKKTDFPDITTGEELKQYCANQYANGTPVTVWYVLVEPTTGIVNEPLRKIGDYADTLSMEQAGVSIPTNNGSTTVDVETTVKPSEVYIKYKGV